MQTTHETDTQIQSLFKNELKKRGYLITSQRECILEELLKTDSHFDIESLVLQLKKKNIPVSRATVYRTLAHLEKAGLVRKINFDEAQAHYEVICCEKKHHEHLLCQKCGKVIEFSHDHFENHIEKIAQSYGFHISSHSVEIFGICAECYATGGK